MSLINWSKWRRSLARRHDRIVRLLGMPHRAILNRDFEESIRRWRNDGAEHRLRYDYHLTATDLVLDLGGFRGDWTAEIAARYGCEIHVFEPVPAHCEQIRSRFARNRRVHVHPFGLAGTTGMIRLGIAGDASGPWRRSANAVQVELLDVATFLETHRIERIGLCKINIEGGEYDLLERLLDAELVRRFTNLQIQFHLFVPHAADRMASIQRRLAATHALTYQYPFVWENWQLRPAAAAE